MTVQELRILLDSQRDFFASGATLSVESRMTNLKILYQAVKSYETEIAEALQQDLGKSGFESYMCETGMVLNEISHMMKKIKSYAKKRRVATPLAQFPSRSYQKPTPYGNVLIMSPWNYPFLLSIGPLIDAMAAGNTAVIKPSAYSPHTGSVIEKMISQCFHREYVAVVTGGRAENAALLNQKFDLVFFTGSQAVGKEVLRHTAETLTPAVLELGGKSPCIVDDTANIGLAAKRIVFGKFLNCGQTCVAPDYILCHSRVKDQLVSEICRQIQLQYGDRPLDNPDYGRIVNEKHFNRLLGLIDREKVVYGGESCGATMQIEPTVMDHVTFEDAVMQEEIFGPILPILTYDHFMDLVPMMQKRPKPLALYLFSQNRTRIEDVTRRVPYGGGCINDVVIHLATTAMGFGGVGESGMGCYHGKAGFDTFSHTKSIVEKKTWLDLPMRYQPYREKYEKLLRLFMK